MNVLAVPLSQRSAVDYRRYMAPLAPVQHTRTGRRGHGPAGALAQGAEPITQPTETFVRLIGAVVRPSISGPLGTRSSTHAPPSGTGRWCRG